MPSSKAYQFARRVQDIDPGNALAIRGSIVSQNDIAHPGEH
jgi:hypothetical protein